MDNFVFDELLIQQKDLKPISPWQKDIVQCPRCRRLTMRDILCTCYNEEYSTENQPSIL